MTTSEIRAEIIELINGGMSKVSQITSFFKTHRKDVDIKRVKDEASELVKQLRY